MSGEETSVVRVAGWTCLTTLTVAFATSAWAARPLDVPRDSPIDRAAHDRALRSLTEQIGRAAADGESAEVEHLESMRRIIAASPVRRLGCP